MNLTGLTLLLSLLVAPQPQTSVEDIIRLYEAVPYAHEYEEFYTATFQKFGRVGFAPLKACDSAAIATQAAWEEIKLTIPVEKGDRRYVVDREKLLWFLGFYTTHSVLDQNWILAQE